MPDAQSVLNKVFGYDEFRLQQKEIIENLIAGNDAMVLMPTGGGKSLCYQIPAICRDGVGIVISPLIALMQDQVDALKQSGVNAAYINSSQNADEQQRIEQQLLNRQLDLLYITPERLLLNRTLSMLKQLDIALFAIDEAHCVSQWGHDFRPEYQQLQRLHQNFTNVPIIALTATADKRTQQEIIEQFDLHKARQFISSFDRPNIHYRINEHATRDDLWTFINNSHQHNAGIIYCLSRNKVDETAQWLSDKGREALPYHAGLSQQQREQNQRRFIREDGVIIVATIAFGMGIDKPDVRFVAHLNLPKSIEAYYQETGRAGRDGLPADAWMTYSLKDLMTLKQMNQDSSSVEQQHVSHNKLETLMSLCETTDCRRQHLLNYFGEASEKKCGNCDICIDPPETWDATEAARKALSCVYRTGQRFGVGYVVDVLRGKNNNRIEQNRHHQTTTYGIGKEHSQTEWKNIFRQLIGHGFLDTNPDNFGAMTLTEKSRPLLRNEINLNLRKLKKQSNKATKSRDTLLREIDEPVFEALRQKRLSIAKDEGVPPYVIFHDKTLIDMARLRPANLTDMSLIAGIGDKKLNKFGQFFIDVLDEFEIHPWMKNNLSETINLTLSFYQQHKNVQQVAELRELTESTIYTHLSKAIESSTISIEDIEEISHQDIELARQAIQLCAAEGNDSTKSIYDSLNGDIDYGAIHCIKASMMTVE